MNEKNANNIQPKTGYGTLDSLAVAFSGLCLIHCLFAPLLLSVSPFFADSLFANEDAHRWLLLLIVPVSMFALRGGFRQHHDQQVLVYAGIGLSLLTLSAIAGPQTLGDLPEKVITTLGGLVLAFAHVRNYLRMSKPTRIAKAA
jgi:hypothetical protein